MYGDHYLNYKTVRILCVCVWMRLRKLLDRFSKFFLQLIDLPLDIIRKILNFSLGQPISSNWMIFKFTMSSLVSLKTTSGRIS